MTIRQSVFQCVPNFSEGRRISVVNEIVHAAEPISDIRVIDTSADPDHNRSVVTLLGAAAGIRAAALAMAQVAVTRIDLRQHRGIHPRTGAIDVLPVVPIRDATRDDAITLAREIGSDLATSLELPVYFYEWAAYPFRRSALPDLRRGGFEAFAHRELTGEQTPDLGPHTAHPSAGIAIVGARGPLVAYNINLESRDIGIARSIVQAIRRDRNRTPELDGVRALALFLATPGCVQISMNLTRPDHTSLPAVYAYVTEAAAKWSVDIRNSEIIGVIPEATLGGATPESIRWLDFKPNQILETWLPTI